MLTGGRYRRTSDGVTERENRSGRAHTAPPCSDRKASHGGRYLCVGRSRIRAEWAGAAAHPPAWVGRCRVGSGVLLDQHSGGSFDEGAERVRLIARVADVVPDRSVSGSSAGPTTAQAHRPGTQRSMRGRRHRTDRQHGSSGRSGDPAGADGTRRLRPSAHARNPVMTSMGSAADRRPPYQRRGASRRCHRRHRSRPSARRVHRGGRRRRAHDGGRSLRRIPTGENVSKASASTWFQRTWQCGCRRLRLRNC